MVLDQLRRRTCLTKLLFVHQKPFLASDRNAPTNAPIEASEVARLQLIKEEAELERSIFGIFNFVSAIIFELFFCRFATQQRSRMTINGSHRSQMESIEFNLSIFITKCTKTSLWTYIG